jgi:hypothetical protein
MQGGKRLGAHATNSNRWIFPLNEKRVMRGGFVEDSKAYSRSVNLNTDTLTGQQFFYLRIFSRAVKFSDAAARSMNPDLNCAYGSFGDESIE